MKFWYTFFIVLLGIIPSMIGIFIYIINQKAIFGIVSMVTFILSITLIILMFKHIKTKYLISHLVINTIIFEIIFLINAFLYFKFSIITLYDKALNEKTEIMTYSYLAIMVILDLIYFITIYKKYNKKRT